METDRVYVDSEGNVVEPDDPRAAFIYSVEDAAARGYITPKPAAKAKPAKAENDE